MSGPLQIHGEATPPNQRIRDEWAESLADHLTARGWSRKDLRASLLERGVKVTEQAVGQWLRGETSPRPHTQAVIAAVLGVPAHRLFPVSIAS